MAAAAEGVLAAAAERALAAAARGVLTAAADGVLAAAAEGESAIAAEGVLAAAAEGVLVAAVKGVLAVAAKGVRFCCRHHRLPVDSLQQRDQNLLVWHHQRWSRRPAPLPSAEVAVSLPRQGPAAGLSGLFGRPQISASVH